MTIREHARDPSLSEVSGSTGLYRPQLPALSLSQIGFDFSSPGLTRQVMLTAPAPTPLKFV